MRRLRGLIATGAAWLLTIGLAVPAFAISVTATLLPSREAQVSKSPPTPPGVPDDALRVVPTEEEVLLEFDLGRIPADAEITRCCLRLVAKEIAYRGQVGEVKFQVLKASPVESVDDWPEAADNPPRWETIYKPTATSLVALSRLDRNDDRKPNVIATTP